MDCTARTRRRPVRWTIKLTRRLATATSELDHQTFTHEFGAVERRVRLTRDDIASVHRVLVLNETEPVHELDIGNLTGAMACEVVRDILFCG